MSAENLELCTKLEAVAVETDKTLEELAGLRGARNRVEGLVRSMFVQSIGALYALSTKFAFSLWIVSVQVWKKRILVVSCTFHIRLLMCMALLLLLLKYGFLYAIDLSW